MDTLKRVNWVYSAENNEELASRYDVWAKDYERDLIDVFGRMVHDPFVDAVMKHVPKNARILDAGAGTGLIGACLQQHGYQSLVGIDLSAGMLKEARRKNVYRELYRMVLGERLAFPDDSFDATISAGVFTVGHAPAHALRELIRVTRSGGYILFTLRPDFYATSAFANLLPSMEASGDWRLVDNSTRYQAVPLAEPDLILQVWIYQVS